MTVLLGCTVGGGGMMSWHRTASGYRWPGTGLSSDSRRISSTDEASNAACTHVTHHRECKLRDPCETERKVLLIHCVKVAVRVWPTSARI